VSALEGELPDRNAKAGRDVHVPEALHDPAALLKLAVDFLTCNLFGRHGKVQRRKVLASKPENNSLEGGNQAPSLFAGKLKM
jgi:hypothetical protein